MVQLIPVAIYTVISCIVYRNLLNFLKFVTITDHLLYFGDEDIWDRA